MNLDWNSSKAIYMVYECVSNKIQELLTIQIKRH